MFLKLAQLLIDTLLLSFTLFLAPSSLMTSKIVENLSEKSSIVIIAFIEHQFYIEYTPLLSKKKIIIVVPFLFQVYLTLFITFFPWNFLNLFLTFFLLWGGIFCLASSFLLLLFVFGSTISGKCSMYLGTSTGKVFKVELRFVAEKTRIRQRYNCM